MGEISVEISSLGKEKARAAQKVRFQTHHRARMFAITFLSDLLALFLSTTLLHGVIYRTLAFEYISMGEMEKSS